MDIEVVVRPPALLTRYRQVCRWRRGRVVDEHFSVAKRVRPAHILDANLEFCRPVLDLSGVYRPASRSI
jgi:hypothetical protein